MAMNKQRRTANLNNILTYDSVGNSTLIANLTIEGLTGAGFVKADANGLLSVDTAAYTVTTGATNYLTKITAASTLGQSLVYDNGTSVYVNSITGVPGYNHAFQVVANTAGGLVVSTTNIASAIGIVNSSSGNKTWDISPFNNTLVINESGVNTSMVFHPGGNITVGDISSTGHKFEIVGSFRTTGNNTLSQLQGVGTRMVVADTNGLLSTQAIDINAILPSQAGNAGKFFKTNGSTSSWSGIVVGDVAGAVSSLSGEVATTGTGALDVTLSNIGVVSKVLTGLSVSAGTLNQTDSILAAFGKLQGQVNALSGGTIYKGTWNATTNTPTITSSVGTSGHYYIVATAGTTNINGVSAWDIGDWIIFDGSIWQKVDNTDSVTSVNGLSGSVNLTTSNITEGTNLYYTDARARAAISLTTTGTSGAATYSAGVLNVPNYTLAGLGGVSGTGITGQVSYWSGASAQAGTNNLFWDAATNRLGVNINTPSTALHVVGNGFINGRLGVGTSTLTSHGLHVGANISGAAISYGVLQSGTVQAGVSTLAAGYENQVNIADGLTANAYHHFRAVQNTLGAGATLAFQAGFFVTSTLTSATNNYGFYGNMPSGTGSWNIFMAGAGNNYMAGNLLLGNSSDTTEKLQVTGTAKITGATSIGGALNVTGAISAGSGPSNFAGVIRATNTGIPTTGAGVEIGYVTTSSIGFITSASRDGTAAYTALNINGLTLSLNTASNGAVNFGTGNAVIPGKVRSGASSGTSAYINIGINSTAEAQFNLATSGFTPTSPANGDGWFDGTNIKFRISGSTTNFITGALTSGYISKATGTSAIANSLVYDNGTSVLVNTNTAIPTATTGTYSHAFQILGNAAGGMIISTDDDSSAIGIVNSASSNKTWDISPFGNDLAINESGVTTRMKFKAAGNIEIPILAGAGTRMVVADTSGVLSTQAIPSSAGSVTSVSGTGGYGGLTLSGTVTSSGSLTLGGTPTGTWPISITGNAGTITVANTLLNASYNIPLVFSSGNTSLLIDGGNELVYNPSTNVFTIGGSIVTNSVVVSGGTANQFMKANGTLDGNTYLKGSGTTGRLAYWLDASTLSPSNAPFWDITNQRLGINTATPSYTLHVGGDAYIIGALTASNFIPSGSLSNSTNTIGLFGAQTLNIPAATIGSSGVVYAAGTSANYMRFNGNTTMNGDALFAGKVVINSIQFDTTGTVTMSNSAAGGQRALSGLQVQMQFAGATSGTVTKGASILIQGAYPNNTTGTLTFTDYYGLRINDLLEWDTGSGLGKIAVTNKWAIYQAGINDRNYFAGNMLLNNISDTGQILQVTGAIRVNGQRTSTSGVASGQFLSINCDGTTYKIQLLNP